MFLSQMFIRDVKSSNGTFINGERLSPEGQESEVFELHNEDVVEFGIDIVSDDSKTIVHHKVAGRVYLVLTAEDALGIRNDFASIYRPNNNNQGGTLGGPNVGPGAEGGLRRGKSTISFDHIIGKLQMELQRSREQGQEISNLATTVNEIGEMMDGGVPPMQEPPYQHMVPPLQQPRPADSGQGSSSDQSGPTLAALQAQLSETQSSLSGHVDRIRTLESMLAEQELMRTEVGSIKSQMAEAKRELDQLANARAALPQSGNDRQASLAMLRARDGIESHSQGADDDFDDGASMVSVSTVTPGADVGSAPKGTDEVESEALDNDGHVGPRAPPDLPPELAARDAAAAAAVAEQGASNAAKSAASLSSSAEEQLQAQNNALGTRLEALELQLEEALSFGRTLQSQHVLASETVKTLESRVQMLESQVKEQSTSHEDIITKALEGRFSQWKEQIEADWKAERKDWESERDNLKRVIEAWDSANGKLEEQAAHQIALGEAGPSSPGAFQRRGSIGLEGSDGGKSGASTAMSSGASSSSSNSRRRASKSAKRRQAKRHLNPSLRALLYKESHNDPMEDEGGQSSDDEEPSNAKSRARNQAASGSDSLLGASEGTSARSTNAAEWLGHSSDSNPNATNKRNKAVDYAYEHPAQSIPALSAVAVVVAVAAWAALGGKDVPATR